MSLLAILLFVGTMALSLWATMRVRQAYGKFSQFPASSGASGAETAATILRQEGIYDVASARARLVLKQAGLIQTIEEETPVAKVLRAATWTYVAAFITSVVYFLLHVLPLLGGRRE